MKKGIISLYIVIKTTEINVMVQIDDKWKSICKQIYPLKDFLEAESSKQMDELRSKVPDDYNFEIDMWISRLGNDFCGNSPIGTIFDFRFMDYVPSETQIKEFIFKQKSTVRNSYKIFNQYEQHKTMFNYVPYVMNKMTSDP